MTKTDFIRELNDKAALIDRALDHSLPQKTETPAVIHEAMRYSIFAGGKRLRPILFLASAEAVGGNTEGIIPAACALELIHTYSLVHDDLPAMDNDDFRRGQPTSHIVFGEAVAILTGDALLTYAFEMIAECGLTGNISPQSVVKVIKEVTAASGSQGMIGGQVVDILSENKAIGKDLLEYIHRQKTGALFRATVRSGALMGGANEEQLKCLTEYAENLGLAFQITDDVLDVEGDSEKLGKAVGSDERKKKSTYPSLYGLAASKDLARSAVHKAAAALSIFGDKAGLLKYIAEYLLEREK